MKHGATPEEDVTLLFVLNKSFRHRLLRKPPGLTPSYGARLFPAPWRPSSPTGAVALSAREAFPW